MDISNKKSLLMNNIIDQAKYYLDNEGEFYPFGAIITSSNFLKPLGVYFGDEFPKSIDVLNNLETAIKLGVVSGNFLCGAIGLDILIPVKPYLEKKDALEIRTYVKDKSIEKTYFLYNVVGATYEFIKYDFI